MPKCVGVTITSVLLELASADSGGREQLILTLWQFLFSGEQLIYPIKVGQTKNHCEYLTTAIKAVSITASADEKSNSYTALKLSMSFFFFLSKDKKYFTSTGSSQHVAGNLKAPCNT